MFRIKIGLSISTIYFDNTNHNHPKKYAHCHCGLVQVALFISFCVTSLAGRQSCHGPLTRYLKLWAAHAPRMSGTFSPPPSSKETASYRPRHASRHVRPARAVMHVRIANPRWRGKRSRPYQRMRNPQFYISGKRPIVPVPVKQPWGRWVNLLDEINHNRTMYISFGV